MTVTPPGRPSYRWLIITLLAASGATRGHRGTVWPPEPAQPAAAVERRRGIEGGPSERAGDRRGIEPQVARLAEVPGRAVGPTTPGAPGVRFRQGPALSRRRCVRGDGARQVECRPGGAADSQPHARDRSRTRQTPASADQQIAPIQFRFRTDTLLRELAFPDSFGLIFIATEDGEVLYQDAPTRRRWLRHLRWGEQTFRDGNADRPPALQIRNLQQVAGITADAWRQLRSVSSRTSVQLGGTAHQLYLQPLLLDVGGKRNLVIGGAVPTSTIVTDALALDTYLVGVLAFLLMLGVLGFPFVKLAFLAPRERFRLRDISLLYVSTGALLVLMTCGSLAVDGYVRWHAVADTGVKALAEDLERRFLSEVTSSGINLRTTTRR